MVTSVIFCVQGNHVGTPTIPLQNADKYNISPSSITLFGDSGITASATGWTINENKNGFSLEKTDTNAAYFFGTQHEGKLFVFRFSTSLA